MKNQCGMSGHSLRLDKTTKRYWDGNQQRVVCPICNRNLAVARPGFTSPAGRIPIHKDGRQAG